jgi:hypothetical protein
VGWEFTISSSLTEHFWANGCGDMVGREKLYGDWLLTQNLRALRVVGVRKRCWVPLEWASGNILGGGARSFVILFVLRWGMGHILVFGMIGGVEIDL